VTQALTRLADGDRSAFDTVYEAAWPRVRALAARMLGEHPAAEDVAQDALLTVFDRASAYDPAVGPAIPWILGIAGWAVRTRRQRVARRREEPVPAGLTSGGDPEAEAIRRDLLSAVEQVLGRLDERDRQALLAAAGDRPSGATFRKRLQRARRCAPWPPRWGGWRRACGCGARSGPDRRWWR